MYMYYNKKHSIPKYLIMDVWIEYMSLFLPFKLLIKFAMVKWLSFFDIHRFPVFLQHNLPGTVPQCRSEERLCSRSQLLPKDREVHE